MRTLAAVLLVSIAACAPAAAGPASTATPAAAVAPASAQTLAGTYNLRQINGHDLPAMSPTESNVQVIRGMMQLNADGTYSFALTGRRNQEPTPGTETRSGNYTVSGDMISFDAGRGPSFRFAQSGSALTLRDDQGNSYLLDRQ